MYSEVPVYLMTHELQACTQDKLAELQYFKFICVMHWLTHLIKCTKTICTPLL